MLLTPGLPVSRTRRFGAPSGRRRIDEEAIVLQPFFLTITAVDGSLVLHPGGVLDRAGAELVVDALEAMGAEPGSVRIDAGGVRHVTDEARVVLRRHAVGRAWLDAIRPPVVARVPVAAGRG